MKIVVSKLLVDSVGAQGALTHRSLFGRTCEKQNVIQVVGFEPKFQNQPLEHVGYWIDGADNATSVPVDDTAKCTLFFNESVLRAEYCGKTADVIVYDPANYHSRHRSLVISQNLAGKRVAVIGGGSIGQKAAKEFAKHGVAVSLFEMDTIEIENPYRLNLGIPLAFSIGVDKCSAIEEDILLAIPGAKIQTYNMDIAARSKEFDELIAKIRPDVMFLSVDTRDGTRQANSTARHHGIPLFQAVLSDGAETGQIRYVSSKPADACLLCLDAWDNAGNMDDSRRQYAEEQSRAQKAVPALSVDTAIIAYISTKLVMSFLAGEDIQRYFTVTGAEGKCAGDIMWISTTPETWIMDDFLQKVVAKVEKSPKCPGCWTPDLGAIRKKKQEREERK